MSATATTLMRECGEWKCTYDRVKLGGPLDRHREGTVVDLSISQYKIGPVNLVNLLLLVLL
jgi:hypothetical protein